MTTPLLIIGNRNYSSWSLRAYLALALAEIEFDVSLIPLDTPTAAGELAAASPSARVPVLKIGDDMVWESLAIAEWAAEKSSRGWPMNEAARCHARSIAAEMHAGFPSLRRDMPMNIRGHFSGVGHSAEALADAAVVLERWREARARFGGGGRFLYGDKFTVADAMFAPVATRFVTYGVELDEDTQRYVDAVYAYSPMATWIRAAKEEEHVVEVAEPTSPQWQGGPLVAKLPAAD